MPIVMIIKMTWTSKQPEEHKLKIVESIFYEDINWKSLIIILNMMVMMINF